MTSPIPMLSLGLPATASMALMMQGIVPGPGVLESNPALVRGLVVSMPIGNALLVILNLPFVGIRVKLPNVPYGRLFPGIPVFSCRGLFSVKMGSLDIFPAMGFAPSGCCSSS